MTMRFVCISTGNTRPLIAALGERCDAIDLSGPSAATRASVSDIVRAQGDTLDAIAERNVTRRRIRLPWLFERRAVAAAYRAYYRKQLRRQFHAVLGALAADRSRTVLVFNGYLAPNALLALAAEALGMKPIRPASTRFPPCPATPRSTTRSPTRLAATVGRRRSSRAAPN